MSTIAELLVKIGANNSGLVKELNASKRQLAKFKSEMPDLVPDGAGKMLAALGVGVAAFGIKAVKLASDMEVNRLAFETMLGSGEKAKSMLSELATFAEKTPFEFDSLVTSAKRMLGLGVAAEEILPQLKVVGDAVAAVGGNSTSVDSITNAFAKMQASGFISAEQMNRLTDSGIPGWKLLAEVLSDAAGKTVTVGEAMTMAEAKSINATTAISGMMTEMSTRYGGAMDKMSGTNVGIWSNIHDTAVGVLRDIGDQLNTSLDVKKYLNKILSDLTVFKANVQAVGIKQALIDGIPAGAVATSLGGMSAVIMSAALPAMAALAISIRALGLAAGPVGWAITSIGALTTLVAYNGIEYEKTGGSVRAYNSVVYDGIGRMSLAGDTAGTLSGKINGVYSAAIQAAQAMVIFNQATGDVAGGQKSHIPYASAEIPAVPAPWASPAGSSGGSGKDPADEARRISEAIEREWAQTIKTQLEQLERWQTEQLADLEKTQAANENYERDKERVASTYSVRRQKILQEEAQEALQLQQKIKDGYADMQTSISQFGLTGSAKGLADIENESKSRIKTVADFYKGIQADFVGADNVKKAAIIANLDATGVAYKINEQGNLNFAKEIADQEALIKQQSEDKKTEYHKTAADTRAEIDAAMQSNSMTQLQAALTAENAARLGDYAAQQSMMATYQEASIAANMTWQAALMSVTAQGFAPMKSAISDMLTGAKTIGEAFSAMGKSILKSIADIVAGWVAGQLTMMAINALSKALGINSQESQVTKSAIAAKATAAAWAPAAAMVSLATFGENAIPAAIGIAAVTGLSMALAGAGQGGGREGSSARENASGGYQRGPGTSKSDSILSWLSNGEYVVKASAVKTFGAGFFDMLNGGRMPALAAGGIVTGPPLAAMGRMGGSISSLSVGRALGKMAANSNGSGGGGSSVTQNVYGDIRTEADYERMFDDFGSMIANSMQGA